MIEIDVKQKLKDYMSKSPEVKTTIHWWDLYKGHYIKLKPDIQKQIFDEAIEKVGGRFTWLEKKLKISRRTIAECWKLKRNPQISTLIKIARFINFSLDEIEKNIIYLSKSKFKPNLPFKMNNPEGAEIRAAFLSDGHLPSNPTQCPIYSAYEKELHWRLINAAHKIFGNFSCKPRRGNKTPQTRFPAVIGKTLELSGIPRGDKRLTKHYVPHDIIVGNKNIQIAYLRRVFDDEGDICFDKYGKRAIRLTRSTDITIENSNHNSLEFGRWTNIRNKNTPLNMLLLGEQLLLYKLGIDAKIYFEGVYKSNKNRITAKWRIQIGQQDSIRKFAEKINFNLKTKRRKLSRILKSYKQHKFSNNEGKEFITKKLNQICRKRGCFSYGDLSREFLKIRKSYDLSSHYLQLLIKRGIIKKLCRGKYVFIN